MQRLLVIICRVLKDNPLQCLIQGKCFSKNRINVSHKTITNAEAPSSVHQRFTHKTLRDGVKYLPRQFCNAKAMCRKVFILSVFCS